jgi:hypothetical protein
MSSILLPISPAGTTTANISGQNVVVSSGAISIVSGSITVNSGTITASVSSGAVSVTSGAISVVSGSITVNSGTIFLPTATQSGHNYVLEVGNSVLFSIGSGVGLGSFASGGMTLASSGPLISLTIRSQSGNGPMNIGGAVGTSGTAATGVGIELFANESVTLKVNNSNLVSCWNQTAGTSGQKVTMIGIQQI